MWCKPNISPQINHLVRTQSILTNYYLDIHLIQYYNLRLINVINSNSDKNMGKY